jgi:hypothetical protein
MKWRKSAGALTIRGAIGASDAIDGVAKGLFALVAVLFVCRVFAFEFAVVLVSLGELLLLIMNQIGAKTITSSTMAAPAKIGISQPLFALARTGTEARGGGANGRVGEVTAGGAMI